MVVMAWIARSGQPFSVVNEPSFQEMMSFWNPRLSIKHSTTFSKYKLPMLYESVIGTMKKLIDMEVSDCQQVAFTTDCWTSKANDPYITLTLHYINSDFELRKFVLNFENFVGRHTGYHIGRQLDEMIREYPSLEAIPKKVIVHDAANNMKSGVDHMEIMAESLICGDHLLNTSLLHATNAIPIIKSTIQLATDLATKLKRSTLAAKLLMDACNELGIPYVKVITPCATRWNSNCMMIGSILRLKVALVSIRERADGNVLQEVIPTSDQFCLLEVLHPVLKVMETFSESLSKDSKPFMQGILISLHNVLSFLKCYPVRMQEKKQQKHGIMEEFCSRLTQELCKETRFDEAGKLNIKY